jgi:hypothetical protein
LRQVPREVENLFDSQFVRVDLIMIRRAFDEQLRADRCIVTGLMKSPEEETRTKISMSHMDHKMSVPGMRKDRTPYKFVGEKIITYYADNGGYRLVAYDTSRKKASQLARSDSREEIERMVAGYDDARKIVGKAATRKMREMLVPAAKHQPRAPRGPEIER